MRLPVALLLVAGVGIAGAAIVPGGGSSRTDCLSAFDAAVNWPTTKPKEIRCADGDPACDADGTVNGSCAFAVAVCANGTFNAAQCTSPGVQSVTVDHAADDGDPLFDPDFQGIQNRIGSQIDPPSAAADACTSAATVTVTLKGPLPGGVCKAAKKKVRLTTLGVPVLGKQTKDVDVLKLTCLPPVAGCDPTVLFPTGTFQRIERQVFSRSCAVSGCHDSQSQAGGMLLESASAYTNLVDVPALNFMAAGDGWKRVDGANADPATSFLMHKITGDLPSPAYGLRMPRNRPKLDQYLIDLIRLWIEAGAPASGWVPGTDG